jgi:hypothetical protein
MLLLTLAGKRPPPGRNPQSLLMDDLTARLADLFRRYQIELRRIGDLSEGEVEQVTEPFQREVNALIAEHGRDAVVRAALLPPVGLPTLN